MRRIKTVFIGVLLIAGFAWAAQAAPDTTSGVKYTGSTLSLDFQEAPVRQILQLIADVSGNNIVISDDVEGTITLKLKKVPWDQALDIVLQMNNLGMETDGNIIRVTTLENLARQRDDISRAEATRINAEPLSTRVVALNYTNAGDLVTSSTQFLSARGQLTADERTNSLIIKDIESNIGPLVELIQRLDSPTPQVIIEARIVQVRPSFNRDLGIQWGGGFTQYGNNATTTVAGVNSAGTFGSLPQDFAVNLPASGTVGALGGVGVSFGRLIGSPLSLDLRLTAGESRGLTKIISTPKITVLDNQTARISQGENIPFQTTSQDGTQTTFEPAELALEVTPHVTGDGMVSMQIGVSKNAPGTVYAAGVGIDTNEAETSVLLKNGETTVIGGIYERSQVDSKRGLPFFSKLPLIGWMFRNSSKSDNVEELLIFITPRIVK